MNVATRTIEPATQLVEAPVNLPATIPHSRAVVSFDQEKLDLVRRTIAKGATDDELMLFIEQCKRTQLDPFARQIYCVKRWDGKENRDVMAIQTSIDGFRLIAERTGQYAGQLGPFWCGKDGEWRDVWVSDDKPLAAKVGILRHGWREPVWGVARFDAYSQTKQGNLVFMWKKMGDVMIAKCAEALGLRKAFPQELSGLYTADEMSNVTTWPMDETPEGVAKKLAGEQPKTNAKRAERAAADWETKFAEFKKAIADVADHDALMDWAHEKGPEISGFPDAMRDELRALAKARKQEFINAAVADQVVIDDDGERTATADDFETDEPDATRQQAEPKASELPSRSPEGSAALSKPTGRAPVAPEPKPDAISQRAITVREAGVDPGKPPKLQEVPQEDIPTQFDRRPNAEKFLAGLELAAETAKDLMSLNKAQAQLMTQKLKTMFPNETWAEAIAIFRARAHALTEGAAEPEPDAFNGADWLRELGGALSGAESLEQIKAIKEGLLLENKSKADEETWSKAADMYRARLNEMTQADLLRV